MSLGRGVGKQKVLGEWMSTYITLVTRGLKVAAKNREINPYSGLTLGTPIYTHCSDLYLC